MLETTVHAKPEVCFDLSRDIDLHVRSMARTGERAIAGRTNGLIAMGEEVTWEGRHLGIRQRLTSRITAFDRPRHFQDTMVRGALASFRHDHHFEPLGTGTRIVDAVEFAARGGPMGVLVERLILRPYLERLLAHRNQVIKTAAEESSREATL